jgi:hypothetical protein
MYQQYINYSTAYERYVAGTPKCYDVIWLTALVLNRTIAEMERRGKLYIYIYVVPCSGPLPIRRNMSIRRKFRDRRHIGSLHENP